MKRCPEYRVWASAQQRCHNPNAKGYENYGGRGITVCTRWRNSFEAFFEDMGPRPSADHSIERKDNDKGYSPDNCCWATRTEQLNNRRVSVHLTHGEDTFTIAQWSELLGVPASRIYTRIAKGWSVEAALELGKVVKTPHPDLPLKKAARRAVYRALLNGKVQRPNVCPECTQSTQVQAHHHNGYDQAHWLDVLWLCAACHQAAEPKLSYH